MLKLTADNYYSPEADMQYFSCSQIKDFKKCSAMWYAKLIGEYIPPYPDAFKFGHYVDCALLEPDKFPQFCIDNAEWIMMRSRKDKLSVIKALDESISAVRRQPLFMEYLSGDSQDIITCEMFSHQYKCRMDVVSFEHCRIVDLKTSKDIRSRVFCETSKAYVSSFIDAYDYWIQAALYREAVRIKYGVQMEFFIAAMEKTAPFDHDVFDMTGSPESLAILRDKLFEAKKCMDEMSMIKGDRPDPMDLDRCERCEYCVSTRVLTKPKKIKPDVRAFVF